MSLSDGFGTIICKLFDYSCANYLPIINIMLNKHSLPFLPTGFIIILATLEY